MFRLLIYSVRSGTFTVSQGGLIRDRVSLLEICSVTAITKIFINKGHGDDKS
jgi:hypothetical protein